MNPYQFRLLILARAIPWREVLSVCFVGFSTRYTLLWGLISLLCRLLHALYHAVRSYQFALSAIAPVIPCGEVLSVCFVGYCTCYTLWWGLISLLCRLLHLLYPVVRSYQFALSAFARVIPCCEVLSVCFVGYCTCYTLWWGLISLLCRLLHLLYPMVRSYQFALSALARFIYPVVRSYQFALSAIAPVIPCGEVLSVCFVGYCTCYTLWWGLISLLCRLLHLLYPVVRSYQFALSAFARVIPCCEVLSVCFVGYCTCYTLWWGLISLLCRLWHALYTLWWGLISLLCRLLHLLYPVVRSYQFALSAIAPVIPCGEVLSVCFVGFGTRYIPCGEVLSVCFVGFCTRYTMLWGLISLLCRLLHALYHAVRSYQFALSAFARVIPCGEVLSVCFVGFCTRYTMLWGLISLLCRLLHLLYPVVRSYQFALSAFARVIPCCEVLSVCFVGYCTCYTLWWGLISLLCRLWHALYTLWWGLISLLCRLLHALYHAVRSYQFALSAIAPVIPCGEVLSVCFVGYCTCYTLWWGLISLLCRLLHLLYPVVRSYQFALSAFARVIPCGEVLSVCFVGFCTRYTMLWGLISLLCRLLHLLYPVVRSYQFALSAFARVIPCCEVLSVCFVGYCTCYTLWWGLISLLCRLLHLLYPVVRSYQFALSAFARVIPCCEVLSVCFVGFCTRYTLWWGLISLLCRLLHALYHAVRSYQFALSAIAPVIPCGEVLSVCFVGFCTRYTMLWGLISLLCRLLHLLYPVVRSYQFALSALARVIYPVVRSYQFALSAFARVIPCCEVLSVCFVGYCTCYTLWWGLISLLCRLLHLLYPVVRSYQFALSAIAPVIPCGEVLSVCFVGFGTRYIPCGEVLSVCFVGFCTRYTMLWGLISLLCLLLHALYHAVRSYQFALSAFARVIPCGEVLSVCFVGFCTRYTMLWGLISLLCRLLHLLYPVVRSYQFALSAFARVIPCCEVLSVCFVGYCTCYTLWWGLISLLCRLWHALYTLWWGLISLLCRLLHALYHAVRSYQFALSAIAPVIPCGEVLSVCFVGFGTRYIPCGEVLSVCFVGFCTRYTMLWGLISLLCRLLHALYHAVRSYQFALSAFARVIPCGEVLSVCFVGFCTRYTMLWGLISLLCRLLHLLYPVVRSYQFALSALARVIYPVVRSYQFALSAFARVIPCCEVLSVCFVGYCTCYTLWWGLISLLCRLLHALYHAVRSYQFALSAIAPVIPCGEVLSVCFVGFCTRYTMLWGLISLLCRLLHALYHAVRSYQFALSAIAPVIPCGEVLSVCFVGFGTRYIPCGEVLSVCFVGFCTRYTMLWGLISLLCRLLHLLYPVVRSYQFALSAFARVIPCCEVLSVCFVGYCTCYTLWWGLISLLCRLLHALYHAVRSYQFALSAFARVIPCCEVLSVCFVGYCTCYTLWWGLISLLCRLWHALYTLWWGLISLLCRLWHALYTLWWGLISLLCRLLHALYHAVRSYQFALSAIAPVIPCGEVLSVCFVGFCTRYTMLWGLISLLCRLLHLLYHAVRSYQFALSAIAPVIPCGEVLSVCFVGFGTRYIPCGEVLSVCFVGFCTRYTMLWGLISLLCRLLHALYPVVRSYQFALSAFARVIPCCEVLSVCFVGYCTCYTLWWGLISLLCRLWHALYTLWWGLISLLCRLLHALYHAVRSYQFALSAFARVIPCCEVLSVCFVGFCTRYTLWWGLISLLCRLLHALYHAVRSYQFALSAIAPVIPCGEVLSVCFVGFCTRYTMLWGLISLLCRLLHLLYPVVRSYQFALSAIAPVIPCGEVLSVCFVGFGTRYIPCGEVLSVCFVGFCTRYTMLWGLISLLCRLLHLLYPVVRSYQFALSAIAPVIPCGEVLSVCFVGYCTCYTLWWGLISLLCRLWHALYTLWWGLISLLCRLLHALYHAVRSYQFALSAFARVIPCCEVLSVCFVGFCTRYTLWWGLISLLCRLLHALYHAVRSYQFALSAIAPVIPCGEVLSVCFVGFCTRYTMLWGLISLLCRLLHLLYPVVRSYQFALSALARVIYPVVRSYQFALSAFARVIPCCEVLSVCFVGYCTCYTLWWGLISLLCRLWHALYTLWWGLISLLCRLLHALYHAVRSYQFALSAIAPVIPCGEVLSVCFVGFGTRYIPCGEVLSVCFVGYCTCYTLWWGLISLLCRLLHLLYPVVRSYQFALSALARVIYPVVRSYQFALSALARVIYPVVRSYQFALSAFARVIPCCEVLSVCFVGFCTRYTMLWGLISLLCRLLHALYPVVRSYQFALSAFARVIPCCEVLSVCFVGYCTCYTLWWGLISLLCRLLHALYPVVRSYQFALSAFARVIPCCEVLSVCFVGYCTCYTLWWGLISLLCRLLHLLYPVVRSYQFALSALARVIYPVVRSYQFALSAFARVMVA